MSPGNDYHQIEPAFSILGDALRALSSRPRPTLLPYLETLMTFNAGARRWTRGGNCFRDSSGSSGRGHMVALNPLASCSQQRQKPKR
jgi:hypothetical protein